MIRLEAQPYCQECMDFEAEVEKPTVLYTLGNQRYTSDTVIRCERRRHCEAIRKFLEKQKADGTSEKGQV